MEVKVCRKNKYGYCKYGDKCHFRHEKEICINNNCNVFNCDKRHPRLCSWFQEYGRCKFTSFCKFKHSRDTSFEVIMNKMEKNENKLTEINTMLDNLGNEEVEIKQRMQINNTGFENRLEKIESEVTSYIKILRKRCKNQRFGGSTQGD